MLGGACHPRPPPPPPASAYTALGARRGPWVFPSAGVVGSPRQDILGAMLHLAWDGWLSWRGTHCLVLWTPWTGRRHSLHCLGWLRLRFPMLGCQGAEHSPGRVPTAALRHATSHTQVSGTHVHHMYTHAHRHASVQTHKLCLPPPPPPVSKMHCRPAPIIGTCTLARSHTPPRVAAKLSWGTCQGTGAP